jgi:hypothetical protein
MKPSMKRGGLWAAGVVTLVSVGLLVGTQGYAQGTEDDSKATCSEATLRGTYLFAYDGIEIKEGHHAHAPFAVAGYEVYDGNGEVNGVVSTSVEGPISHNKPTSGTYSVNNDCTGTVSYTGRGTHYDLFIAPDGSMFTFVQTNPGVVASGFELQSVAKRISD